MKKQYALNKLFNFLMIFALILWWASSVFFRGGDTAWGLGTCAAALLITVSTLIFTPYCYAFDSEGLSLQYVFLTTERFLWKDIEDIVVEYERFGSRSSIIDLIYSPFFAIQGHNVGKNRFYMKGHVRKSFRTKYLLEKYWDGTISGYFFEDVKKWIDKRRKRKKAEIKAHLTDEIVPMEREIRALARKWTAPFIEEIRELGLEIKIRYLYITDDFKELNDRPDEKYTYMLSAEIAKPGETDDEKILTVDVDLISVRLGKTAYRGVINKCAQEEIELSFSDLLKEIREKGIEAYFSEL